MVDSFISSYSHDMRISKACIESCQIEGGGYRITNNLCTEFVDMTGVSSGIMKEDTVGILYV